MSDELNWIIVATDGAADAVQTGKDNLYGLLNTTVNKVLRYGRRDYGVNLDWEEGTGAHVSFVRSGDPAGPLEFGEQVALHVTPGGFLYYREREYGINLEFRAVPAYEWQILNEDPSGIVESGSVVALRNTTTDDCVFYEPRTYGINLKWVRDKGTKNSAWYERVLDKVAEKAISKIG